MPHIEVKGHATWVSVGAEKDQTVLLLHGGMVNGDLLLDSTR
jgi:hypothetical protein